MATLFKKVSKASFVIATGDCPDTLRFRVNVAEQLKVPFSSVEGFVGGEHGSAAYPLWSQTTVAGWHIDEYLAETGKKLDRDAAAAYVRGVSKQIVDTVGATEFGPAAGFRDIARAILTDSGDLISFATPRKFPELPEPVHVSVPTFLGASIGPDLWDELTAGEQANIKTAAKAIHDNYRMAAEAVGI
jgi:malate dehydrogenase